MKKFYSYRPHNAFGFFLNDWELLADDVVIASVNNEAQAAFLANALNELSEEQTLRASKALYGEKANAA